MASFQSQISKDAVVISFVKLVADRLSCNAVYEFPGELTTHGKAGVLTFFYKDHQATTLERIVSNSKQLVKEINGTVENFELLLGGGIIGVSAAIDEENYIDTMIITPVVMIMAFIFVMIYYESLHAGWLMVLPMLFTEVVLWVENLIGFFSFGTVSEINF